MNLVIFISQVPNIFITWRIQVLSFIGENKYNDMIFNSNKDFKSDAIYRKKE